MIVATAAAMVQKNTRMRPETRKVPEEGLPSSTGKLKGDPARKSRVKSPMTTPRGKKGHRSVRKPPKTAREHVNSPEPATIHITKDPGPASREETKDQKDPLYGF